MTHPAPTAKVGISLSWQTYATTHTHTHTPKDRMRKYNFLSMEKTSRKEHKSKRSGARNDRKTRTRLELGPRVAAIFTQELEVFFVDMIVREYFEGPFSKRRALHKGKINMFRTYLMEVTI